MYSIEPIPAFSDNYIWALVQQETNSALVVDPGEAKPVAAFLEQHGLTLSAILVTHHHWDHTGGLKALRKHARGKVVPVYGPSGSPCSDITHPLKDGAVITACGMSFEVLAVPGHTLDHIAFFSSDPANAGIQDSPTQDSPILFCGDTLFSSGCGRLFEGSAGQLQQSLSRLAALPSSTRVYCTHEYTLSNLAFAQAVEPDNAAVVAKLDRCTRLRKDNQPTLPSTIGIERETNPFLRVEDPAVIQAVSAHCDREITEPEAVFASLRRWKDHF